MKRSKQIITLAMTIFFSLNFFAFADSITKPHTFSAGAPAKAAEVNADFDTLYNQVNKIGGQINIDATNNRVGIGTAAPTEKLDVNGTVKASAFKGDGSGLTNLPASTSNSLWSGITGGGVYYNGGNVGIGTTSPIASLEVAKSIGGVTSILVNEANGAGDAMLSLKNTDRHWTLAAYGSDADKFIIRGSTASQTRLMIDSNGNVGIGINDPVNSKLYVSNPGIANLIIAYNGTGNNYYDAGVAHYFRNGSAVEQMTVLANGNVGIGTTAPSVKLQVLAGADSAGIRVSNGNENIQFNHDGSVGFLNSPNSAIQIKPANVLGVHVTTSGNVGIGKTGPEEKLDIQGNIRLNYGSAFMGIRSDGSHGRLIHVSAGNWGSQSIEGSTVISSIGGNNIQLNPNNGNVLGMIVDQTGNVGIGTTTPTRKLSVNGDAGGTSAWNNDSDARLKKNIETIDHALDKVLSLRGVTFDWIDTSSHREGRQMGFIGQESENIIPEVVDQKNGYYTMQYAPITALLVEAVKDQQSEIEMLKTENSVLKAESIALKTETVTLKTENEALKLTLADLLKRVEALEKDKK